MFSFVLGHSQGHTQCSILNSCHCSSRVTFPFLPTNIAQQIAHLHKVFVSSRKHHIYEGHCCQCYCCKNIGCNMGIVDHCFRNALRVAASQLARGVLQRLTDVLILCCYDVSESSQTHNTNHNQHDRENEQLDFWDWEELFLLWGESILELTRITSQSLDARRSNNQYDMIRTVLQFMFKRPTTASIGKAPQSKEELKGSGWEATPNMNLDSGLLLTMVWNPILNPHPLPHT